VSDPRYGSPPGFGGGGDEPPGGEFQPGEEPGVVDPNAGRYGGRIAGFLGRTGGIGNFTAQSAGISGFEIQLAGIADFRLLPMGG
jgi:hypothetical protein